MELIFSVRYFSIPEYGKLLEDTFNFFCLFVLFFKEKPFAWVTTGLPAFCMYRDIKERLGEQISTIVLWVNSFFLYFQFHFLSSMPLIPSHFGVLLNKLIPLLKPSLEVQVLLLLCSFFSVFPGIYWNSWSAYSFWRFVTIAFIFSFTIILRGCQEVEVTNACT